MEMTSFKATMWYTISTKPLMNLLRHISKNNIESIIKVLERDSNLLNRAIEELNDKTVLHVACDKYANVVSTDLIRTLLNFGADVRQSDRSGKEAIHHATLGLNPDVLDLIIGRCSNINATTNNGDTALLLLVKEADPENPNFETCAKKLLEGGVDVNKIDDIYNSAINCATKTGYRSIVELLLKCEFVDIDTSIWKNRSCRSLIEEDMGLSTEHVPVYETNNNLIHWLWNYQEDEFIGEVLKLKEIHYLQYFIRNSAKIGCKKILERLVLRCLDMDRSTIKNIYTPVKLASINALHKIYGEILEHPSTVVSNDILFILLRKLHHPRRENYDACKCFELLLEKRFKDIDVNSPDKHGVHPLYYSATCGLPEHTLKLLSLKASLANSNQRGNLTIAEIDAATLNRHFDSCIEAVGNFESTFVTLMFDYQTLLPTEEEDVFLLRCISDRCGPLQETSAVLHIGESPTLRHLLKHPLIMSFLDVKWNTIRWIYYSNALLYLFFCLSLVLFVEKYYFASDNRSMIYMVFLIITSILMLLRESFQFLLWPRNYWASFENYMELLQIVLVFFMVIDGDAPDKVKRQIWALLVLLVAFQLLFLIGNYSDLFTNIAMLRTVTKEYLKFFLFYSIILIGFGLCFNILFQAPTINAAPPKNSTNCEQDNQFFVNPFLSIFKTFIMLTGEYEAGAISFNDYPWTSHLIFLLFVFTNAIILLNLLNGLAVSDVQKIRSDAEIFGLVARAEYVANAERIIFLSRSLNSLFSRSRFIRQYIWKPFVNRVCLRPDILQNYKLIVFHDGEVRCERKVFLKRSILKRAKAIVQGRKCEETTVRNELKKVEEKVEKEKRDFRDFQAETLQSLQRIETMIAKLQVKNS